MVTSMTSNSERSVIKLVEVDILARIMTAYCYCKACN